MSSFNPACYLPSAVSSLLPATLACPPPPSFLTSVYNTVTSPLPSTFTAMGTLLDALVSLPVLSFLLIPTMTSYSTSLNLLFFYLTWSTLVLSHPPLRVELVATLAVRMLFYVLPSTLFLSFDVLLPSASESLKAQEQDGLPFYRASRARTLRTLRILGWSILNIFLSVLVQAAIEHTLTATLNVRSALRVTTRLPTPFSILKDLGRGYLTREMLSYTIHRYLLHSSSITPYLTKLHEKWYHSLPSTPFPLSATYDHPLSYLLRCFIPTYFPAAFFRFHLLTFIIYLILLSLEETFAYSGYSTVPTNFILGGIARRTDGHVLCGGQGNYGCIGLTDWLMGTSVMGGLDEDVELEMERHDVERRVKRASRRGMEGVKRRVIREIGTGRGSGSGSGDESIYERVRRRSTRSINGDVTKPTRARRSTGRNQSRSRS